MLLVRQLFVAYVGHFLVFFQRTRAVRRFVDRFNRFRDLERRCGRKLAIEHFIQGWIVPLARVIVEDGRHVGLVGWMDDGTRGW